MFYLLFQLFYRPEGILRFLRIFRSITFRTGAAVITAFLIAIIFGPYFIRHLKELRIGQIIRNEGPETHQVKSGTPTMGGLFILLSILLSLLLWADLSNTFVLVSFVIIFLVGLLGLSDDLLKIKKKDSKGVIARFKFIFQILISILVFIILYHINHSYPSTTLYFPIFKYVKLNLGIFYAIIVIIVFTGSSNAVNLTDGLDGLAIGSSTIAFAALGVISYLTGNAIFSKYLNLPFIPMAGELTVVCFACFGAGIGFLWYNTYPAEVFMGDVGSLTLGALFGGIAIMIKQEILIIIIGGIFVLEALSVIMQVSSYKMTKKRIFRMAPLHHHFELQGIPEPKIVMRFWIIALILSLIAIATLKLR